MQNQLFYRGRKINIDGPVCSLPYDIIWPLCAKLSNETAVDLDGRGGDWRNLAGHIGLPVTAIELIRDSKDRTKAYALVKLWDQGIRKNRGTVRKLVVALYYAGFGESFLKYDLLQPLLGTSVDCVHSIVVHLESELDQPIFPPLDLSDIVWDEEMEQHTTHVSSLDDVTDDESVHHVSTPAVCEDCVYISHYTKSKSKTYAREVKNLICLFETCGYKVYHEDRKRKYMDLGALKEKWIKSAANIIVVFNKEYQRSHEAYSHGEKLPTCLEVDIPLISHIFHNGGRSRIIPVVIDQCRTQPPSSSFPVWLTGSPRRLFPSQTRELLACVQNVPLRIIRPTSKVRIYKPQVVDGDAIRRSFLESKNRL